MSLSIRCGLTIGPARSAGSGGGVAPPVADLSDIDLTAATLDRRLKFSCASSRAYYAADGTIQFADPNVWPLEYRDGVAVGRHEPEPQRTNPIIDSRITGSGWRAYNADITNTTTAPDGGQTKLIAKSVATADGGMYQTRALFGVDFPISLSVFGKSASVFQAYVENTGAPNQITFRNTGSWQYATKTIPADAANANYNGTVVIYSNSETKLGDTFAGWGIQAETGEFSTSPIITPSTAAATRAAAFASVTNPGRAASGIQIWYTDGDVTTLDFNGAGSVDIPVSEHDWGTRYISRITYVKTPIDPLRDIDLTAATLDSRVTYKRAGNLNYWSKEGTLQQASADVWPVEYRDGVAVGRHEPEPQATNSFQYAWDLTKWSQNFAVTIAVSAVKSPSGGEAYGVKTGSTRYSGIYTRPDALVAGVNYCESVFVHSDSLTGNTLLVGNAMLGGQSHTVDFIARTSTIPAPYDYGFDEYEGGWVRYWFAGAATAAASNAFVIYTPEATEFVVWGAQHEIGMFPSSPIMTAGTAATRPKPIVSVVNPGGTADLLRVVYSGDNSRDFEFPANGGPLDIPEAELPWGTRYILRMRYIVED